MSRIPKKGYDDIKETEVDEHKNDAGTGSDILFRYALQNGNLQTLVLDETDRLLQLGFRRDIQDILSCLNDTSSFGFSAHPTTTTTTSQSRQTLLFSATLAPGILDVVDIAMSTSPSNNNGGKLNNDDDNSYQMVDCVHDEDPATHTNINTAQSYIVLPPERFWTGAMEVLLHLMTTNRKNDDKSKGSTKKKKNKIIVFFEMTRLAQLYSKFLSLRLGHTVGVWEIHGKMHQRERTVVARRFRNASHGILLTSDVSARGVDYPDVSHVIQVGAPQNRETYIHRLGRTGRAGKQGQGMLILPELERDFVEDELEGLNLVLDNPLQHRILSNKKKSAGYGIRKILENELGVLRQDMIEGRDPAGMAESLHLAYHSLVSYYFQTRRRRDGGEQSSETLVNTINQLIQDFGLPELPAINFRRAKSMGIENLSGLNIQKNWEDQSWDINTNDEFRREKSDDLDEWFGTGARESNSNSRQTSEHQQDENRTNNNHREHRSSVNSNHFTKRKPTKTKKKDRIHFNNIQRYDHSGECPK